MPACLSEHPSGSNNSSILDNQEFDPWPSATAASIRLFFISLISLLHSFFRSLNLALYLFLRNSLDLSLDNLASLADTIYFLLSLTLYSSTGQYQSCASNTTLLKRSSLASTPYAVCMMDQSTVARNSTINARPEAATTRRLLTSVLERPVRADGSRFGRATGIEWSPGTP